MSVTLRPLREDEFPAYRERGTRDYADDIVRNAGIDRAAADDKAERDWARTLPQGLVTEKNFILAIEEESGTRVGDCWFALRDSEAGKQAAFVYSITVDPACRGRGYGRAAMELLEQEARARGVDRMELNVFGGNEVARSLYRSLGYAESAVWMTKELDSA